MSLYELAVLGDATDVQRSQLATTVQEMVTDFGLRIDVDVVVHDGGSIGGRDRHAAFAAVYECPVPVVTAAKAAVVCIAPLPMR